MRAACCLCLTLSTLLAGAFASAADAPASTSVVRMQANPARIELTGPGARLMLLVEGEAADGRLIDLTASAKFRSLAVKTCAVSPIGEVQGRNDGEGSIEVV